MAGTEKENFLSLALDLSRLENNNVDENNETSSFSSSFVSTDIAESDEKDTFKAREVRRTVEIKNDEALCKKDNVEFESAELFESFSSYHHHQRAKNTSKSFRFPAASDVTTLYSPPKNRASTYRQNYKDGKKIDYFSLCGVKRKDLFAQKRGEAGAMQEDPMGSGDNPAADNLKIFHDKKEKRLTKNRFLKITGLNNPRDEKLAEIERTVKCKLAPSLPVSAPGTQRKLSKIPLQSKPRTSSVRIANYRPDYVWNRGGRLKEIRIRYLARKFTFIWRRKVFGRLSPAAIRSHWRHKSLVKYFRHWCTISWHSRREWRLLVRADCHYRFWLRVKTLRAWRLYVTLHQQKKTQLEKSLRFYNRNQLRRRFFFWQFYVDSRRKKYQLFDNALHFNKQKCYRNIWKTWQEQMSKVNVEKTLILKADFWKKRHLQKLTLQRWYSGLCVKQELFKKQQIASNHRDSILLQKSLVKWSVYVSQRRKKIDMKIKAEEFSECSITCRAYGLWTAQFNRHQMVYKNTDHLQHLRVRLLLRQMWSHWRHYVSDQRRKKMNIQRAESHSKQRLLILSLAGFQLHLNYVRNLNHLAERLLAEKQRLRLRKCFLIWVHRFDLREEMRQHPLTIKALHFHRHQLLKKSFRKLKHYVSWRRHRQTQYAKAEAHFYISWFPKYLQNWRQAVEIVKRQKRLKAQAQEYWEENTLCNIFYIWQEATNQNQEYQEMETVAVSHYDHRLLHGTMGIWQQRTSDCLKYRHLVNEAENYFRWRTLRQTMLAWKQYVNEVQNMRYQHVISLACYYGNLQHRCFSAWKQYCIQRKEKHQHLTEASDYYERCLSVKVWKMWRSYVSRCQQISNMAEEKYRNVSLRTLRWAFHIWHDNSHKAAQERKNLENAQHYYNQRLLAKVLGPWRNFAAIQSYKKSQIQTLVWSARKSLQTAVVHRLFIKWRHCCHESAVDKQKVFLASSHHRSVVLRKSFQTWKLWLLATYKKKLLIRQSLYFRHQVLLVAAFNQWIKSLNIVRHEKHRTHLALWHWSANLQRKVLLAWKAYYSEQLRKRRRIDSAVAERRQRLLREGLQCWISTADQLASWRKTKADRQQTQSAVSTLNKVRCFAHRWHQKTIAGRSQKAAALMAPCARITKHRTDVFPQISIGDPSISITSELLAPAHRPQPLYPSFLDDSQDVDLENSNSEYCIKITKATTKAVEKQVQIKNPVGKLDPPELVEGPVEPLQTPETPPAITSERLSPGSLEVLSVEPGLSQPVNAQSDTELLFEDPVSKDPGHCQIQEKDSDVLLMTPNDFQVSKEASDENLRSEVIETSNLLLKYKAQRQKLTSLKEYLRMLQSWNTKDPDLSSIDIELSQTEQDISLLKTSLHEQKHQLKARVEKLTQNSLQA